MYPTTLWSSFILIVFFSGDLRVLSAGDLGSILGSRRPSGERNDYPLQYSCLGNPIDGGAWLAPGWLQSIDQEELDSTEQLTLSRLGFSINSYMPSANSDFYFFPSNLGAFYFFVCVCMCLIAVARIVNIMINRSGESVHACPVPDLKGKAFSFSSLSMMLAVHVHECVSHSVMSNSATP